MSGKAEEHTVKGEGRVYIRSVGQYCAMTIGRTKFSTNWKFCNRGEIWRFMGQPYPIEHVKKRALYLSEGHNL